MAHWFGIAFRPSRCVRGVALVTMGAVALLAGGCAGGSGDSPALSASVTAVTAATPPATATTGLAEAYGIYVVTVDTGDVRRLPLAPAHYFGPSWSPDGRRLAFSAGTELVLTDPDGQNLVQLTHNERSNYLAAWSADGREILFISQEGDDVSIAELFRIDADGRNERRLTTNDAWEYRADWSPDASHIMFRL